jgi:hypothetical protein
MKYTGGEWTKKWRRVWTEGDEGAMKGERGKV